MKIYGVKLLFQFRVVIGRASSAMRTTEERVIHVKAASAVKALRRAKQIGGKSEFNYLNDEGNRVHFEFIGIMDLLHLGIEREKNEVWYEIRDRLKPMERRQQWIPAETELTAIKSETS